MGQASETREHQPFRTPYPKALPLLVQFLHYYGIASIEEPGIQATPHRAHAEKAELRQVFPARVACVIRHVMVSFAFRH